MARLEEEKLKQGRRQGGARASADGKICSRLSAAQLERYRADGFVCLPGLFLPAELAALGERLHAPPDPFCSVGPLDWLGWTDPRDDLIGTLSRIARLVHAAEALLEQPCYHWHSKVARKPPGRESSLDRHQDYGSWYKDGCLLPDLVTAVVALTKSTTQNGCLTLMRGSHRLGRLDRLPAGVEDYTYFRLNPKRLAAIRKRFESVPIEMSAGDVLLFHPNTLHASGPNRSEGDRLLLEITYNACSNGPVFERQQIHAPTPLLVAPDDSLLQGNFDTVMGRTRLVDLNDEQDPGIGIFKRHHDPGQC